jgi:4a-hydroxytetrahydrobiopterin dehydratase
MALLTEDQIATGLARLEGWKRDGASIRRQFTFPTFASGIAFVNRVAAAADRADHHPDIDIRYTRVTLTLSTHSAGGITDRDLALAEEINGLAS